MTSPAPCIALHQGQYYLLPCSKRQQFLYNLGYVVSLVGRMQPSRGNTIYPSLILSYPYVSPTLAGLRDKCAGSSLI